MLTACRADKALCSTQKDKSERQTSGDSSLLPVVPLTHGKNNFFQSYFFCFASPLHYISKKVTYSWCNFNIFFKCYQRKYINWLSDSQFLHHFDSKLLRTEPSAKIICDCGACGLPILSARTTHSLLNPTNASLWLTDKENINSFVVFNKAWIRLRVKGFDPSNPSTLQ